MFRTLTSCGRVCCSVAFSALIASSALAGPSIRITPPLGARLVPGQRFDLRVEFTSADASLSAVSLSVDGVAQSLTLGSLDAFGGVTLRKRSFLSSGWHTVRAQATDG